MAAYLSPIFGAGAQLFNNQGIVLAGGKIWTYQAGTTTPLGTWTDSTQVVVNANPIILDSAGRPPNEIWLQSGSQYKFILMDSNNNILGTWDFVSGVNDISTSITVSEWSPTGLTPSYISATSFSVTGNNVALFDINRRVKLVVSAGTVYGYVVSSVFGSVTTVVIQPDSTGLDAGLSAVSVGLLDAVNVSVPQQYPMMNAPIALTAAATTNIGAALSTTVTIDGTTTIAAFDTVLAGMYRFVNWNAATPITYNVTTMQLIGSASRTNAVGDFSIFRSLGSGNWIEEVYQRRVGNYSDTGITIVASATTPNIFGAPTHTISYTGTATATGFAATTIAGQTRTLICTGQAVFTAGANLLIDGVPSGNSVTMMAGAQVNVMALTTTQFELTYSYSGSFVASATGFTTVLTASINYFVRNGVGTIVCPTGFTGSSNAASFTATGLPVPIRPSGTIYTMSGIAQSGGIPSILSVMLTYNTSVITFDYALPGGVWAVSGTKTAYQFSLTYSCYV